MKKIKENQGITLIALVITIIVMLILVGVTLSMISGENGIFGKAEKAVSETSLATIKEDVELAIFGLMADYYSDHLGEYGDAMKYVETQCKNTVTTSAGGTLNYSDGTYEYVKDGQRKAVTVSSEGKVSVGDTGRVEIPEGLKIGSEVSYSPSGTYTEWTNAHSGGTDGSSYCDYAYSLASESSYTDSSTQTDMSITSWKVFSINESTGKVQLVPATATTNNVGLNGADGYNNSVKLLNDACSSLYGNSSKGITARSIKIEDIEGVLDYKPATEYTNTSSGVNKKYGERLDSAYEASISKYPNIYAQEKNRTINGTTTTTGLGLSDKASSWVTGETTTATSIQPMQTYYRLTNSNFSSKLKTISNGEVSSYSDLLLPSADSTQYWVASRCVSLSSSYCSYRVSRVYTGNLGAYDLYESDGAYDGDSRALFPVVTLSSELISTDGSGNFEVK